MNFTLKFLWVFCLFFYDRFYRRTKTQTVIILQDKCINLIVLRLCSKSHFGNRELTIFNPFKNTYPKWLLKNTVSLPILVLMTIPPYNDCNEQRMDNPEG